MPKIDWLRETENGFTVEDIINGIDEELGSIMSGTSYRDPFTDKEDMRNYVEHNMRYYTKQEEPQVGNYFIWKYRI